jgi:hypothetical protein
VIQSQLVEYVLHPSLIEPKPLGFDSVGSVGDILWKCIGILFDLNEKKIHLVCFEILLPKNKIGPSAFKGIVAVLQEPILNCLLCLIFAFLVDGFHLARTKLDFDTAPLPPYFFGERRAVIACFTKLSFGMDFAPIQAVSRSGLFDASRIIPSAATFGRSRNPFVFPLRYCDETA